MANFGKTAFYECMADFIDIMDEDELRELAEVCKVKADLLQQDRREHQRDELIKNLQNVLTAIQRAGFSMELNNPETCVWELMPNDVYSIEMHYVGK